MDEPFGPLDAQTRVSIGEEFLSLWDRLGKSVVFVTHDIEEAIALSDRVIVLCQRPGMVKEEFVVDLPRPRPFYLSRFEPQFKFFEKRYGTAFLCRRNTTYEQQLHSHGRIRRRNPLGALFPIPAQSSGSAFLETMGWTYRYWYYPHQAAGTKFPKADEDNTNTDTSSP